MDAEPISYWISNVIMATCRMMEILVVTFLTAQLFKKSSNFKSAYFIFLNIGYFLDVLVGGCWLLYISYPTRFRILMMPTEWYNSYFYTLWNTVLACNRCTAIIFPLKQAKIWSTPFTAFIGALLLLSPILIDTYNLIHFPAVEDVVNRNLFRQGYLIRGTIINIALTLVVLIFIAFSMIKTRHEASSSLTAKIERRLVYQALFSSICIIIYFFLKFLSIKFVQFYGIITNFSAIMFYCYTYSLILSHFIFSPVFCRAFFKFYLRIVTFQKSSSVGRVGAGSVLQPIKVIS